MRHGFLLINKPTGPTSHDVVAMVRKTLGERSVGHLGTLDPLASGLLVLAVGKKALKVVELFRDLPKEYEAEVRFGAVSTTYDAEGVLDTVEPAMGWTPPSLEQLTSLIRDRFLGRTQQTPPAHSAVKISGERAYRKARQGRNLDIPPREVLITRCSIRSYAYPDLSLQIACGSGTYIRSLANDLGQMLRSGSYLAALKRTRVGDWLLENAIKPNCVKWTDVSPLKDVLQPFPRVELMIDEYEDLKYGRNIEREVQPRTIGWFEELPVAMLVPAPDGTAHARKVF